MNSRWASNSGTSSERKPFVDDINHFNSSDSSNKPQNFKYPRLKDLRWTIGFQLLFLAAYTVIFFTILWKPIFSDPTTLHPIPHLNIRYVPVAYTDFEQSPFAGPPSASVDKAWHDLLEKTNLRVSQSELRLSNQSSVELPENGGYMAWLGVYHQLHCIKMLRQWNYREHYHPNITEEDRPHWDIHADHCLDILRSAAMCHADTTLTTFGWADQPKPMLNTRPIDHRCVDWDALMESVEYRVVSRDEMASLLNPNLGGTSQF
ncbi:Oxidase ustYa [Lachnellula cervina]|uniref:Oxidase ustYa n=1 Tax=Lachnellula cervina TaxID=1316786 RepID=A0A7D8YT36_9HELO|nr:Oxidase ustYa [Lachnellula cervina]